MNEIPNRLIRRYANTGQCVNLVNFAFVNLTIRFIVRI